MNQTVTIAYAAPTADRPRYYANDHSLDTVRIAPRAMPLVDARGLGTTLDREGFELVAHNSVCGHGADDAKIAAHYPHEIAELLKARTGAGAIAVTAGGVRRFSERSPKAGTGNNSMPARFVHVDISNATAADFAAKAAPEGRRIARAAHYNVWRVLSPPPQDVPLALCDARSVAGPELILADAIFDEPHKPHWSFEGLVVAHDEGHRWHWFSDMSAAEAIIFKTNDSDPARAHCVPHVAFDDAEAPADCVPRASIEMRAIAYWFE
jgi:hypothetical protein